MNIEREAVFIKCILSSRDRFVIANAIVEPADLSVAGSIVYSTARHIFESAGDVSFESVAYELQQQNLLDAIGGIEYLNAIKRIAFEPDQLTFERLCKDIVEESRLRTVRQDVINIANAEDVTNVDELVSRLTHVLYNARREDNGCVKLGDLVDLGLERTVIGSTSIYALDEIIGGITQAEYCLIAARPSVGKTALLLQMALSLAENNVPILYFSIEQTPQSLVARASRIVSVERLREIPFFVSYQSPLSVERIFYTTELMKLTHGVQAVFVDYIGLLAGSKKFKDRNDFITYVSGMLQQAVARKLQVATVVASQLNRNAEREGRMPELIDLRDSGSLEQDADVVVFIHRSLRSERAKLIVAKNREGRCGTCDVVFDTNTTMFVG